MTKVDAKTGKSVSLQDVSKSFGDVAAVRHINLEVSEGEFCTLLGPSGSGKTTTLKMIAGFEPPTTGRLLIGGKDVTMMGVAKRNIGMVFQNYALFPHMTVRGNVAFPLEMRHASKATREKAVREALSLVGLETFADRRPRQLSGGQQQRVALARALVFDPDILLMDEPLGALDKNLRQNIQLELKKLHRRLGVTIVYVTHDQEEALHLSDKIVVMSNGSIEQAGTPADLYNFPKNSFVAGFLGECNLMEGRLEHCRGSYKVHLAIGALLAPAAQGRVREGDGVCLGVRPEKIRLGREAHACQNRFRAVVEDVIFIGTGYKILLRADPFNLIAIVANRESGVPVVLGDEVEVGFNVPDGFLLPCART